MAPGGTPKARQPAQIGVWHCLVWATQGSMIYSRCTLMEVEKTCYSHLRSIINYVECHLYSTKCYQSNNNSRDGPYALVNPCRLSDGAYGNLRMLSISRDILNFVLHAYTSLALWNSKDRIYLLKGRHRHKGESKSSRKGGEYRPPKYQYMAQFVCVCVCQLKEIGGEGSEKGRKSRNGTHQIPNFLTFKETRNRYLGIDSASIRLASRYDNPMCRTGHRFLGFLGIDSWAP